MGITSAEPVIFLYMASYSIMIILTQDFILSRLCLSAFGDSDCGNSSSSSSSTSNSSNSSTASSPGGSLTGRSQQDVQDEAVRLYMSVSITISATSILSSQLLGYWMDRCSRKALMLPPVACMVAWSLGVVVLASFPQLPIYYIFVAIGIGNMSGGYVTLKTAVTSYVIQETPESRRTIRLSFVEAAIFLGGAIGLLSIPFLSEKLGASHATLFMAAESLAAFNMLYIVFLLPDDGTPTQSDALDGPGDSGSLDYGTFHGSSSPDHHIVASVVVTSPEGVDITDFPPTPRGEASCYGTPPEDAYGTPTLDVPPHGSFFRARHALSTVLGVLTGVAGMSNPSSRYGTPPEEPHYLRKEDGEVSEKIQRSRCHSDPVGRTHNFYDDTNRSTSRNYQAQSFGKIDDAVIARRRHRTTSHRAHPRDDQYWTEESSQDDDDSCSVGPIGDGHYPNSDFSTSDDQSCQDNMSYDVCDGDVAKPGTRRARSSGYEEEKREERVRTSRNSRKSSRTSTDEKEGRWNEEAVQREGDRQGVCGRLIDAVRTTFRYRPHGVRNMVIATVVADFLVSFVVPAETDTIFLYVKAKLGWSFNNFAFFYAIKCCTDGVALLLLLPLLRRWLGLSDATIGVLGGLSRAIYFILLGTAFSSSMIYSALAFGVFGQYLFVSERAIVSGLVDANEQGRVFTVLSSVDQMALLLGSLSFDNLFPVFLHDRMPGVTLMLAGFVVVLPTIIFGVLYFSLGNAIKTISERRALLEDASTAQGT